MLHTKFHQNRPSGSWKEDFLKCFIMYGHGSNLGHVTSITAMPIYGKTPSQIFSGTGRPISTKHGT